ncbi:tryptophan synthase subunit alpha [Ktedonosporobacter rubrisoli]|uniref:Tryptophan synthase alpha chain n=1 Tax=Ktedonosporobacter rubrisoli TaxID=2509675 RepID=A0A4P6K7B3_KTERU|nr:tryptophan synthase subunit alpha [Ktedonosporobacter rubrisoli]
MEQNQDQVTPASRITKAFGQASQQGRGVLIPYLMVGYPNAEQSAKLVLATAKAGADIIELGMPFSDPLADGATIQHAGHVALEQGMTLNKYMEIARFIAAHSNVPLITMGYYNPILNYGIERFCALARESGICGLIVPDLPPEEAADLQRAAKQHGQALIFLIPPTTPDERIERIVDLTATGSFIYCVSLSGVTGARKELPSHLRSFIERVRGYTKGKDIPLAVGFGLKTPEHIAAVTTFADGAVVGSAIVDLIDQYPEEDQVEAIQNYVYSLHSAL